MQLDLDNDGINDELISSMFTPPTDGESPIYLALTGAGGAFADADGFRTTGSLIYARCRRQLNK